jgi:WD40-like Beta Propeller Repeat/Divergent InlB B-repeat domain
MDVLQKRVSFGVTVVPCRLARRSRASAAHSRDASIGNLASSRDRRTRSIPEALRLVFVAAALVLSMSVIIRGGDARAAFPGQNGKLAYFSAREIWIANADGSGATQLTASPGLDRSPRWSPDGTKISFASERNGSSEIFVMNADGSGQRRLTFNAVRDRTSAWTADGTQVVYDKEFSEIYAINADGSGGERKLADGLLPGTSRYGNKVVFSVIGGGLSTMSLDGTARREVTARMADYSANWSPGGTDLVFARGSETDRDVYAVHANGLGLVRLTNTPGRSEVGPVWSPDGTKIAFLGCPNPLGSVDCGIHVMNRDGSDESQVSSLTASFAEAPLDWQPVSPFPQDGPVMLTVDLVAAGGAGHVTSVPAGLECPSVCSAEFDKASSVRLEARPSGEAVFLGWTGACSGRSTSCTVTMDGEKRVRASFGSRTLRLTVSVRGPGRVVSRPARIACPPRCVATFTRGARVALRALPAQGAKLIGWGGACRGLKGCTVSMTVNRSVRARFRR